MDRDANYVAVGAFVVLIMCMAASFVYWYTDQRNQHSYQRYEIYFQGSVSGLSAGSPVRYLGVDVGKVVYLQLDPEQRKRVQVIADVESTAPIDGRTLASLSLQGITGLLFIDLQQDKAATVAGALTQGHEYPVIRSVPSDFDVLLASLPALATHAIMLVDHFNDVFSDENVRNIHVTLENARLASEHLPATLRDVRDLVVDLRHTTQEVQAAAVQLNEIAGSAGPDIKAAVANVRHISDNLAATSAQLDHFLADNEPGISHFTQAGLPELEQLLRESRDAARDFRDLSRSLKRDPSQLLYESNYRGVEVAK